jgi:hypothetical protein
MPFGKILTVTVYSLIKCLTGIFLLFLFGHVGMPFKCKNFFGWREAGLVDIFRLVDVKEHKQNAMP